MPFKTFVVGMYQTNTYVLYDEKTLDALIIDPGAISKDMYRFLEENSLKPGGIILTHYHFDHSAAVLEMKKEFGCPLYLHKADEHGIKKLVRQGVRLIRRRIDLTIDNFLSDGDTVSIGNTLLKVSHTPGHTPGSICLELVGEKVIFTGDTLFANGIGRTDLKDGDQLAICRSLYEKVNTWSNNVTIYPGHGSSATMAEVRANNGLFISIINYFNQNHK